MDAYGNPTTRWFLFVMVVVSAIILVGARWVGSAHPGDRFVGVPAIMIMFLQLGRTSRTPWWDFTSRTMTILLTWWLLYYTTKP